MGNRAVITTKGTDESRTGIYLHWNGGPESVLAFLEVAKRMKVRDTENDESYAMARLTQIIANFLGGTLSLGIGPVSGLDRENGDNGVFMIGADFKIVERQYNWADKVMTTADLTPDQLEQYNGVLKEALEANESIFKKGSLD